MYRFTLEYADGQRLTQLGSNIFQNVPIGDIVGMWINGERHARNVPVAIEGINLFIDLKLIAKAPKPAPSTAGGSM